MTKKKTLANVETDRNVDEYISHLQPVRRQSESKTLIEMMSRIKGVEPKIWGVSIIAFGKYSYQRKNGEEYEWFHVGFSPGKTRLSIYLMLDLHEEGDLLSKLGPHDKGRGCLYIKKLEDVNLNILEQLITKSHKW